MTTHTTSPTDTLRENDEVVFVIKGKTYTTRVEKNWCSAPWFLRHGGSNRTPLSALFGSDDAVLQFCADVYGYPCITGDWPQAKTLEDLTRLVRAVFSRCDKAGPVQIKPGMLIRNLRGDGKRDTVLEVDGPRVRVASEDHPGGINQFVSPGAEIRWPWEESWRSACPVEAPKPACKFKVGEVWKGRKGHLMRVLSVTEPGDLCVKVQVLHCPPGEFQYGCQERCYRADGRLSSCEDTIDLIEKVSP